MINLAHDTKMMVSRDKLALIQDDVGWNPRWPIFHERSGSREEHEGKSQRGTQEKHSNQKYDHTCARSMNTKGDTRSTINKGRYTITGSLQGGGLDGATQKGVLNPRGSSPKRGRGLSRGVDL